MRESDPDRKSTFDLLLGKRTVGRPKRRWIEAVERELKGMDVKDWKRSALERDKWKKIMEEAKGWAVEPRRERELLRLVLRTKQKLVSILTNFN
jgi:hypothetical protein